MIPCDSTGINLIYMYVHVYLIFWWFDLYEWLIGMFTTGQGDTRTQHRWVPEDRRWEAEQNQCQRLHTGHAGSQVRRQVFLFRTENEINFCWGSLTKRYILVFSRLASVQTQVILSGGKDINDPKVMTKLLAACEVKLKFTVLNNCSCLLLVLLLLVMNRCFFMYSLKIISKAKDFKDYYRECNYLTQLLPSQDKYYNRTKIYNFGVVEIWVFHWEADQAGL